MWGVNTLDVSQYLQELDLNKPIPISKTKMCESKEKNRFNNIFLIWTSMLIISASKNSWLLAIKKNGTWLLELKRDAYN